MCVQVNADVRVAKPLKYTGTGIMFPHSRARLSVEIVIIASITKRVTTSTSTILSTSLGELEVSTGAGVLHLLSESLVASNLDIRDGLAGSLHSLLEVSLG